MWFTGFTGVIFYTAPDRILVSGVYSRFALLCTTVRAVDPHSFFADPDPVFLLNADPDPAETNL